MIGGPIDPAEVPSVEFALEFFTRLRNEYPGLPLSEIKRIYKENDDVAGLRSIELAEYALRHRHKKTIKRRAIQETQPSATPQKVMRVGIRPSSLTKPVFKTLKNQGINRAHYHNALTLYALLTLQQLEQNKHDADYQDRILEEILSVATDVSNYVTWKESEKATQAAIKRAQQKGKPMPARKKKVVTAAQILKQMEDNAYMNYGMTIIDCELKDKDRSILDHFTDTRNEHLANNMATTHDITRYSVLRRLAPFIGKKR